MKIKSRYFILILIILAIVYSSQFITIENKQSNNKLKKRLLIETKKHKTNYQPSYLMK